MRCPASLVNPGYDPNVPKPTWPLAHDALPLAAWVITAHEHYDHSHLKPTTATKGVSLGHRHLYMLFLLLASGN